MVFVNMFIVLVNLFVVKVVVGGRFKNKRVGVEIKLFLLIIELMNVVKKLNSKSKRIICKFNFFIKYFFYVIIYSDYLNSNYIKSSCKYVNDKNFK